MSAPQLPGEAGLDLLLGTTCAPTQLTLQLPAVLIFVWRY